MHADSLLKRCVYTAAISAMLIGVSTAARTQGLPSYMQPIEGRTTTSAAEIANQNVLALNAGMFELYDAAAKIFQRNILSKHPVILGLFSGAGGRFILYRPGMAPLEAPQVPIVYQLLKSVGHSTMAVSQVVGPYLDNPADLSWRGAMLAYRSRMQSALDGLDATPMPPEWRDTNRDHAAEQHCIHGRLCGERRDLFPQAGGIREKAGAGPREHRGWAAQTQVGHWMNVIAEWKSMLGSDWDKTYAASNTIYVARQNNVLFSVLAQFFGPDAINDRLMLIETISFTTTPGDMMTSLTRIIADRSVGALFFGNYRLMDYELMGGDARLAIIAETAKRGMKAFLPPAVPFGSKQWPTLVTPGPGPASIADLK